MPSTVPSGAHATARRPVAEPVDGLVVEGVHAAARRCRRIDDSREPGSTRTACVSSQPGAVWRCSTEWSVIAGRCWCSVPAARHVERLRAAADAEDRQAGGVGEARDLELEDVQRAARPARGPATARRRRRSGRGPGRRTGRRRAAAPAARARRRPAAAAGRSGSRPRARARARTACRAPSRAGAARPRAAAACRSARRTSEVVTPDQGSARPSRRRLPGAPEVRGVDRIHTSGIGFCLL